MDMHTYVATEASAPIEDFDHEGIDYDSPNLPEGYDTVLGYFCLSFELHYGMFNENPYDNLQEDVEWCAEWAAKLGLEVRTVEAPEALKKLGVMTLPAYPEGLLELCNFERKGS